MILKKITIEGYRSVKEPVDLYLNGSVTILIGPNDHGKTNILDAIRHLNEDDVFEENRDLNWDLLEHSERFPRIEWHFELSESERGDIRELLCESKPSDSDALVSEEQDEVSQEGDGVIATVENQSERKNDNVTESTEPVTDAPQSLTVIREGIGEAREIVLAAADSSDIEYQKEMFSDLANMIPRVELFEPPEKVLDEVQPGQIGTEAFEFMQGIFLMADIDRAEWQEIFERNDATTRQLHEASQRLTDKIREQWTQGAEIEFLLMHSTLNTIELRLRDPAVKGQYVRASRRSSGFTQFFTTRTMLYARQRQYDARSFIYLFDEPARFLHPEGQRDMVRVIESLSGESQIAYATHNLFMINKNYPDRHRLVLKDGKGTRISSKPAHGRWQPAFSALGVSLAGSILFTPSVLLCEGVTDALYIYRILHLANLAGKTDADLNAVSILDTNAHDLTPSLVRLLKEGPFPPRVVALVDGDESGRKSAKRIKKLCKEKGVVVESLKESTTIENYLPFVSNLYPEAFANYVVSLVRDDIVSAKGDKSADEIMKGTKQSFGGKFKGAVDGAEIGTWTDEAWKKFVDCDTPASKFNIAREYVSLLDQKLSECDSTELGSEESAMAFELAENICTWLKLPKKTADAVLLGT